MDIPIPPARADVLWTQLNTWFSDYPAGVCAVPRAIPGTAFFPGGYGLWREEEADRVALPRGGVMVVGQDFHSATGYRKWFALGTEWPHVVTWRGLRPVLERAGLTMRECFFTNAYMGLRIGAKATGDFPGRADRAFVDRCHGFLLYQIEAVRPRLIVTLGKPAFQAIGTIGEGLGEWQSSRTFRELDGAGAVRAGRFVNGREAVVAALLHPSLRAASLRHRRWKSTSGEEAEHGLLRTAVELAGAGPAQETRP